MKKPITHLIIALAMGGGALLAYGTWYSTITAESAVVATLGNQINVSTETASHVASVRMALTEIASDETSIQGYFVPETNVVGFIDGLEARGQAQGATVKILSVSAGSVNARPTLTFALTVNGTFDAVMRTVGAIEYAPYDLSISSLALGQDAKNSWHADLNLLVGSTLAVEGTNPSVTQTDGESGAPLSTTSAGLQPR